jgi:hypothetical protein
MSSINDPRELNTEQIPLPIFTGWFLWFHAKNLQDFGGLTVKFLQF